SQLGEIDLSLHIGPLQHTRGYFVRKARNRTWTDSILVGDIHTPRTSVNDLITKPSRPSSTEYWNHWPQVLRRLSLGQGPCGTLMMRSVTLVKPASFIAWQEASAARKLMPS